VKQILTTIFNEISFDLTYFYYKKIMNFVINLIELLKFEGHY